MMEVGEGPPVVLVHGLNGFKEGWGPLPGALAAAGRRVVMPDLPGFGGSAPLRRTSPQGMADMVEALVDRLGGAAIVAHSLGAQVALMVAARSTGAVSRLALLAPWVLPRPRRFPPRSVTDLLGLPLFGRSLARVAIAHLRRDPARRRAAFASAVADPDRMTRDPVMGALLDEAAERLATADLGAMAGWAASALALDVRPLVPSVTKPALVVTGALDRVTRPAGAAWLAGALPAGELVRLEGVGHFPHLEAADRVVPAVVGHLA